jgi:uncharacterized SAM-binding protein YcdF (DUF218 family)
MEYNQLLTQYIDTSLSIRKTWVLMFLISGMIIGYISAFFYATYIYNRIIGDSIDKLNEATHSHPQPTPTWEII